MADTRASSSNAATNTTADTTGHSREVNTTADLARLWAKGTLLIALEIKELNNRHKTLKEIAKIEDRFRQLEKRKCSSTIDTGNARSIGCTPNYQAEDQQSLRTTIESADKSDSNTNTLHRNKRQRYTKGIKITSTYTLKVSSILREQSDQKRDIKRVFKGDPYIYQTRE